MPKGEVLVEADQGVDFMVEALAEVVSEAVAFRAEDLAADSQAQGLAEDGMEEVPAGVVLIGAAADGAAPGAVDGVARAGVGAARAGSVMDGAPPAGVVDGAGADGAWAWLPVP